MPQDLIVENFHALFGRSPSHLCAAPGRVNLIGEHTDYNDGFVFPAAIDRRVELGFSTSDGETLLDSLQAGKGRAFDVNRVEPGDLKGWARYAAGIGWALRQHIRQDLPNLQGVVNSTVPLSSGISSSAAIEMAFAVAWNKAADLNLDNRTLALLAQICENEFVGVNCGIMDQMASAMGKAGNAMFLDSRTLEIEYFPIPDSLVLILCDTRTPRSLSASAYNQRRSECEEAAAALAVPALRDASMDSLLSAQNSMTELAFRRARHVITENQRCRDFGTALESIDLGRLGELMKASHLSLREDYEVTSLELDAMAECSWTAPGCVGARMTGAGFGGACIALVEVQMVEDFIQAVSRGYRERTSKDGGFMACKAAEGARMLAY
ncbi:MAG TPA: galactokinase [Fimbriimonadaceae bacterium]|nr:galactokinase [Fimbriimonadaceae bacterium]